jgi:AmmeMemoRadiSam system protein B
MEKNDQLLLRRRSPVANGMFYPENPEALAYKLFSWGLKKNFPAKGGQTILVPHGAWDLTGSVAASAFAMIQGKQEKALRPVSRVLLLGNCHCLKKEGVFLSESDSFGTPIGDLRVDQKINRNMASCSSFIRINDIPHLSEYSLEVLLPMIKYCFPNAKIVPVLMGGIRPELISDLAKALRTVLEKQMEETLIIISSIISQNHNPALALSMAKEFSFLLEKMDTSAFLSNLAAGRISACAGALVGAVMESGLLDGRRFTALCPPVQGIKETGETLYYGAFSDMPI